MAIYRNGELYAGDKKKASDMSTALLSNASLNKELTYIIKENAEMQAVTENIKSILEMEDYDVSDRAKVKVLKRILNVEEGE